MTMTDSFYVNFRASYDQLRTAQKSKKGVSLYSTYVNRPIGRIFAAAFHQTSITPNQVTGIGALLTFGSLLWLAFFADNGMAAAAVGICLFLGFAIDSADGQLARLQGTSSQLGEWLDHILDNARIGVMHLSTLAFLSRVSDIDLRYLMLACGIFMTSSASIFFGGVLTDQFAKRAVAEAVPVQPGHVPGRIRSLALLPVDYGLTCLAYLLLPWPRVFFAVYSLLAVFHLLILPILTVRWARGLRVAA